MSHRAEPLARAVSGHCLQLADMLVLLETSPARAASAPRPQALLSHRCAPSGLRDADAHVRMTLQHGWARRERTPWIDCVLDPVSRVRTITINHASFAGVVKDTAGRYDAQFATPVAICGEAVWEIAARTVVSFLCEDRGYLLVHASGVLRRDGVWLFIGPCASGKTTIATGLGGGGAPFCVDRCIIAFDETGRALAHSTPFSDAGRALGGRLSGPIAGLVFIEQAPDHEVRPMNVFEATRELFKQCLAFSRDRERIERTLKTVGALAGSGLCFKMRFAKNDGFWHLLEHARGRTV